MVQSRLTSARCGRAAAPGWPLLVTGTPRSATVYATKLLQSHGMQVQNDWSDPHRDGLVSWIFAFEDDHNFGPARTQKTFDTVLQQIKEPLASMASMCTEPVLTRDLDFLRRHILMENSRESPVNQGQATLEFWVEWHSFLQKMRFPTYQTEQVEPRDIFRMAHLQQHYNETAKATSSSTNHREHRDKFTWQELYTIDPKYTAEAWDLAHYYGYSYPDVNFDALTCLKYLPGCNNTRDNRRYFPSTEKLIFLNASASIKCPPGTHPSPPSLQNTTAVSKPVAVNGVKGWVDAGCVEYKKRDGTFVGITGVRREDDPDVTDEFVEQLLQHQPQTPIPGLGEEAARLGEGIKTGDLYVSTIKRTTHEGDVSYSPRRACKAGDDISTIGVYGSSNRCHRGQDDVVLHFPLPRVAAAEVAEVQLNLTLADSSGGGVAVVLHGLGPRAVTRGRYPLVAGDFYEPGAELAPPGHVLLAEEFVAAGLPAGATASLQLPVLRNYVRDQLDLPGSSGYTALLLSPHEYHGCEAQCDSRCQLKRYTFDPATLLLTVVFRDGPSILHTASAKPRLDIATVKEELGVIEAKIAGLDGADATQEEALKEIEEELVEEVVAEELDVINKDAQETELEDGESATQEAGELYELAAKLAEKESKEATGEEEALDLFKSVEDAEGQVEDAEGEVGDGGDGRTTGDLCVSFIKRIAHEGDVSYSPHRSCIAGNATSMIGVYGSSNGCHRGPNDVVLQFPLPRVAAADVAEVTLNLALADSSGGGVAVVLHGLGPRAVTHGRYPLAAEDFYEPGVASAPPGHVLLAEEFAATGLPAGTTASLQSPALRNYMRNQLDLPGSSGYTALRLSPGEWLGCEAQCNSRCQLKRYQFVTSTLSLTVAVRDGPPLLYIASADPRLDIATIKEELDVIEGKIARLGGADAAQEEALKAIEEELVEEVVAEELGVLDEETKELELKDSAGIQKEEEEIDQIVLQLTEEEAKVAAGEEEALDLYGKVEEVQEQVLTQKDKDTGKEEVGQVLN